MTKRLDDRDNALVTLGEMLRERGYRFTTPTPATHAIVNARRENYKAQSIPDVFGWSRVFDEGLMPCDVFECAREASVIEPDGDAWRSSVRFSSLGSHLFVHSAFPTVGSDAVFFGPDTYRFARLLGAVSREWHLPAYVRIADIGCGSGAGGIFLSRLLEARADIELMLGDINDQALRFARINAALNACHATVVESDVLNEMEGAFDIIVANPPYLVDSAKRIYRHGGGALGEALSVRIVEDGLGRLRPGGRLVLYTGSAIIEGADTFFDAIQPVVGRSSKPYTYQEIDPDVFGEELREEPYGRADRIAVVGLCVG